MAPPALEAKTNMHFLDQAKIYLKSGAGGPGAVSFRREKFIEYGGPDGGNGGKGGDLVMVAVAGLNTLIDFRYTQHFRAKRGGHGMGKNRTGASAEDLVIEVPVGTQVFDEERDELIADFTERSASAWCCSKAAWAGAATPVTPPRPTAPRANTSPGSPRRKWRSGCA